MLIYKYAMSKVTRLSNLRLLDVVLIHCNLVYVGVIF